MSNRYRRQELPPPKKKRTLLIVLLIVGAIILITVIIVIILLLRRRSQTFNTSAPKCKSNSDCPSSFQCNTSTGSCVECFVNAECAGNVSRKVCDTTRGVCAICVTDSDCGTSAPYCKSATCIQCLATANCPSGQVCNSAGTCITPTG